MVVDRFELLPVELRQLVFGRDGEDALIARIDALSAVNALVEVDLDLEALLAHLHDVDGVARAVAHAELAADALVRIRDDLPPESLGHSELLIGVGHGSGLLHS